MPMYYPDLKSVKLEAEMMSKHTGNKKYTGIIPHNEKELPLARKSLGEYFRKVWNDEIQAIEIEEAVTKETYDSKMMETISRWLLGKNFYNLKPRGKI